VTPMEHESETEPSREDLRDAMALLYAGLSDDTQGRKYLLEHTDPTMLSIGLIHVAGSAGVIVVGAEGDFSPDFNPDEPEVSRVAIEAVEACRRGDEGGNWRQLSDWDGDHLELALTLEVITQGLLETAADTLEVEPAELLHVLRTKVLT
jgi:hypothetical protein